MSNSNKNYGEILRSQLEVAISSGNAKGVTSLLDEMNKNKIEPIDHEYMWALSEGKDNVRSVIEASTSYNNKGLRPVSAALGDVMPDMNTMLINFVSNLLNPPKNPEMLAEAEAKIDDPKAQGHGLPNNLQGSGKIEIS